jgi:putative endonuclease
MDNNNKETGAQGENLAVDYLRNNGYVILDTNWRYGQNEIDIIAKHLTDLVFVEVKTRASNKYGEPEVAVTKAKQRTYQRLAEAYITIKKISMDIRFDIIAIVNKPGNTEIFHIKDAFYPMN